MMGRPPDTGSEHRDRTGPRTALPLSTIEAIRTAHGAGVKVAVLAEQHRLTPRTIYRYLDPADDPMRAVVRGVIADANLEFELGMTRNQVADVSQEIARVLRARGWLA